MDLLEVLLSASDVESGVGLPQKQLQDHIMTFMLAGHEVNTAPSDGLYFLGTVGAWYALCSGLLWVFSHKHHAVG